jgi:phage terminase large subunit GpA-like protein
VPRFKLLTWPKDSTPDQAYKTAGLACPGCGGIHEEKHKPAMNDAGRLIAPGQCVEDGEVKGDPPETDTFSFWVSGLMSPWVSFGQRALTWLRANRSKDQGRIQAQLNTSFGELYIQEGDAPSWEAVRECCGHYRTGEVPSWVQWLFLTVDVQKNRLEYTVRGWGAPDSQSALIEEGVLWGSTKFQEADAPDPEVWDALSALVEKEWGGLPIKAFAVDSGYLADEVYAFVSKYPGRGFACHARETHSKLISASAVEVNRAGRTLKSGVKVWTFDANHFKSWVHGRIVRPIDEPGAWLVPDDVSDDYCKQVTAEALMTLPSNRQRWTRIRKDNHKFDCEVLQAVLANLLNVRQLRTADQKPKRKKKPKRSDEGFWNRDFDNW